VSRSLLFECDPVDQPAATDPVERSTWCALRIRVGERYASRIWDKSLQSERTSLYVPAFPVAAWVVQNWWALLNELCSWDTVPNSAVDATQSQWLKRHCLRSAESSLMLPALSIFHDGQSLRAEWHSDPQGSMPNMPGEFIGDGADQLDLDATQDSLAQFINMVLDRVAAVDDTRVRETLEQWRAIQGADSEGQAFCTLAGRMGIDPYDHSEMTDELAGFLEHTVTSPEDPLVRDLTEVARPDSIAQQWSWLSRVGTDFELRSNAVNLPFKLPPRESSPPHFGYGLARQVRTAAGVSPESPLDAVESVAHDVMGRTLRIEFRNHIPGHGVRAIIGQSARDGDIVAVGPQPLRLDSQRFLSARSLYHALVTTRHSSRLVTDSFSWDQKASRAFAAELIAPQRALVARVSEYRADSAKVESLSREFKASTIVIERQLENAGVSLSYE
jgi:hypothetical protein